MSTLIMNFYEFQHAYCADLMKMLLTILYLLYDFDYASIIKGNDFMLDYIFHIHSI